jgi:ABC-2 type transport system ATP-binding protein
MSEAIRAANVTVRYGRKTAVEDVSFSVPAGSVYALLGRNGAGKSSLVRCLLGQLKADHGRAEVLGEDVWVRREALMDRVGVVAEDPDAPPEMKVSELAWLWSRLYSRWRQKAFDERIERFEIPSVSRFGDLSKGQKKQVTLALALSASPELVVLDDPTLGLDVVARKSLFEEVIADMHDHGITVLITTHDLAPVEAIADRIGVLRGGKIVLDEEVETLKKRFRRIRFGTQPVALAEANLVATAVRQWGSGTEAVVTNYDDLSFERFRSAAHVADVSALSLEEIFIAVTGESPKEGGS